MFRGSFGIIYNPPGVPYFNGVPNGFAPGFQGTNSVSAPFNWDGGYPGVFQPGNKNVDPTTLFPFPTSIDPRALRVGYSDAFNFGVQYELTPNTRVEASYVGNRTQAYGHGVGMERRPDCNLFASKRLSILRVKMH